MAESLPHGYIEPPEAKDLGWLRDVVPFILGTLACGWLAYAAIGWTAGWMASKVSVESEEKFWKLINRGNLPDVPADPALRARHELAHRVLKRLDVAGLKLPYAVDIMIQDQPEPNAFAMPGGRVVLTRGLFDAVKSENGLAFVIGHELGHFSNRDHLRGLGRKLVIWSVAVLFTGDAGGVSRLMGVGLNGIDCYHYCVQTR